MPECPEMRPSTTGLLVSLLAAWLWALPASAQRPQVSESVSESSSSSSEEQRVTVLRPPVPKCPPRARGQVLPCGSTCSSSAKCPGSELCCKYGCHQECLLPVDVNPGYCPKAEPLGTRTCATNCTTDAKCGKGKKCCRWGCFSSCVDAEPAHPGVCPAASAPPETDTCRDACDDDRDCPPRQKCCLTGCRRECTELEQGLCSLPKDPGSCASRLDVFYYDATTATCEAFKYSGCKGNANRFYTKAECLQVCRRLDLCRLPVDPGPCDAHVPMYYYSPNNRSCVPFVYGGCGGNANPFPALGQCKAQCWHPDICALPPKTGPCGHYTRMYHYSPVEKTCLPFPYGGCHGNANRFPTVKECLQTCGQKDVCQLLVDPGPCSAHHLRFYYNPQNKTCEKFTYGGCGGNGNRFETQMECIWKCRNPDVCKLPKQPGPCKAATLRYYYNPATKACEVFTYGGCQGNENRFETLLECEHACKNPDICRLPKNPGEGDRSVSMYRYDPFRKACEIFAYKGQKGNPNRFATLVECQETCRDPDLCQLPVKVGPCEALLPRFHYDATRQMCTRFYYGGCQGNLNNFGTQEGCLLTCKGPEKPGCCPPADQSSCLVSCQKDCQCPGARKCCSSQCGQQCTDPMKGCNKRNLKYP